MIYTLIGRLVVWAALTFVRRRYGRKLAAAGTVGVLAAGAGIALAARNRG
ncbi:MAG: hypothetical protein ACR2NA_09765 [Solirubrobacterales bacterium]